MSDFGDRVQHISVRIRTVILSRILNLNQEHGKECLSEGRQEDREERTGEINPTTKTLIFDMANVKQGIPKIRQDHCKAAEIALVRPAPRDGE